MTIKALILAAGVGSRLGPITQGIPKCLLKVGGQPILEHWLTKLENIGCKLAIVNTHYKSQQVKNYIRKRPNSRMKINIVHEPALLGTAKTLRNNINALLNSTVIIVHADNYMDDKLNYILAVHLDSENPKVFTMLAFESDQPSTCGIIKVNANNLMTEFHEKVQNPPGNLANAAVYIVNSDFLEYLVKVPPLSEDISTDILPKLINIATIVKTEGFFIDIGTPANLAKARKYCKKHK